MRGVLFDARILRPGMTGIGNFARSLLRAMPVEARESFGVLLPPDSPFAGELAGFRIHYSRVSPTAHPLTEIFEQAFLPLFCILKGYRALVAFDGRIPLLHPGVRAYPFVYDLTATTVPGSHNRKYTLLLRASMAITRRSATRVLTISEAVRDQLAKTEDIPPERVAVIHPSDSGLDARDSRMPPGVRHPFFLAVSLTNPRKNAVNLMRAFERYRASGDEEAWLVATGDARRIDEAIRLSGISPASAARVVNLGFAEESNLRWLYENARALVYPSLDEGFGIPLVDAARAGCPVACSDIPVFREVLGDSARFFDPASPEDIARALRAVPVERGASTAPSLPFSWKASARKLAAIATQ